MNLEQIEGTEDLEGATEDLKHVQLKTLSTCNIFALSFRCLDYHSWGEIDVRILNKGCFPKFGQHNVGNVTHPKVLSKTGESE